MSPFQLQKTPRLPSGRFFTKVRGAAPPTAWRSGSPCTRLDHQVGSLAKWHSSPNIRPTPSLSDRGHLRIASAFPDVLVAKSQSFLPAAHVAKRQHASREWSGARPLSQIAAQTTLRLYPRGHGKA